MNIPVLAIVLAMLGAVCFAGAAALQHRAVAAESGNRDIDGQSHILTLRGLRAITRKPGWLVGLALAGGGSFLHGIALVLAPLTVIQPVGVLAVPIAVVLSALRTRRRPAPLVLVGVAVSVAGVAAFVGIAAGTAVSTPAPDSATLFAGIVVAGVVMLIAGLGLVRSGWTRCVACAVAGAAAFGLVSALVRTVSQSITSGAVTLTNPAVLATVAGIVAALLAGGWLVQQALAAGPPEVVIACLTVVDPIVAVLLGAVLLGEGAATPAGTWFLLAVAAVPAAGGVVALARHHPDAAGRSAVAVPDAAGRSAVADPDAAGRSAAEGVAAGSPVSDAPGAAPPPSAPTAASPRSRHSLDRR